jgi:hypothetical protein
MKTFIAFLITLVVALALWTPPEEKKIFKEKTIKLANDFYSWSKSLGKKSVKIAEESEIVSPVKEVSTKLSGK